MGAFVWRVMGTGAAIGTGVLVKNVLAKAWEKGTGKTPPANPESPTTTWAEAAAWAVVSGAVIGLGRMVATRQAARFYKKSTGHLPKGLEEVQ
jgi:Protein of unknown function (DUF4235)